MNTFLSSFGVALILWASFSICAEAAIRGPFDISDGMTFYVVNSEGVDFSANIRCQSQLRRQFPRPLQIRVFDPEERLITRHEFPGEVISDGDVPWDEVELQIHANDSGIYQIIVNGFQGQVDINTEPNLPFGVFGHLQWLCGSGDQFANTYVYLPPGLPAWKLKCSGEMQEISIKDEQGNDVLKISGKDPAGEAELPQEGEHIWQFSARGVNKFRLDFGVLPIILCPDPATASAIKASVDVLPDGTICFHKFQSRIQQILNKYRQMPSSAYEIPVPELEDFRGEWLKEPVRNQLLFGHYGVYANLPVILNEQNLDPESSWFGAIRVWHDANGDIRQGNPFDNYERLGLGSVAQLVKVLAAVYSLDQPFNPLYKNPALLNRIIIGSLQDLMILKEGEYAYPENIYYYGHHAFNLLQEQTGAFPLVIQDCPEDVRQEWIAGLRRLVDRMSISHVGTINQWTFMMSGITNFYNGTCEELYAQLLKRQLRWMIDRDLWNVGQREAGYMTESGGPDATYNGITGHNLAWVYHEVSGDKLLESLKKCYSLFNHTIVPEPDGSWLGSSSFCHRTPADWTGPQYGAGLSMMADDLPEAGLRAGRAWVFPKPVTDEADRQEAEEMLLRMLRYFPDDHFDRESPNAMRASGAFDIHFGSYKYFASKPLPDKLPVEAEEHFSRNLGDEFFCIRRPDYYSFIYAGSPMGEWQRPREPKDPNRQYPRNSGGLCIFWSQDFGVSILSKNWSTYSAHTLITESLDGSINWEDYWSVENDFDSEANSLIVTGKMRNLPLTFSKQYEFLDDMVAARYILETEDALELKSLSECFPYPLDKSDPIQISLLDAEGAEITEGMAQAVLFYNSSAEAHLLVFDTPRRCNTGLNISVDHYGKEHNYGRLISELPRNWQAEIENTFRWCLLPIQKIDSQQAIHYVADWLNSNR